MRVRLFGVDAERNCTDPHQPPTRGCRHGSPSEAGDTVWVAWVDASRRSTRESVTTPSRQSSLVVLSVAVVVQSVRPCYHRSTIKTWRTPMTTSRQTDGPVSETIHGGTAAVQRLLADPTLAPPLLALDTSLDALGQLVYATTLDADDVTFPDEEILNWCFAEAIDHLRAAIWSIAGGFYPTALGSCRLALHFGLTAVHFAINEARNPAADGQDGSNTPNPSWVDELSAWEGGAASPTFADIATRLRETPGVRALLEDAGVDVAGHAAEMNAQLGERRRALHLANGYGAPFYHPGGLGVSLEAFREVVGIIGSAWIAAFPALVDAATAAGVTDMETIFVHPWPHSVWTVSRR
jgi:hypothetical protein